MSEWQDIATAPKDGTLFTGWDSKHGRVSMRRTMIGSTLHNETWAIDPCGIIEPPEPHLWHPDVDPLPPAPNHE